jgi:glycosyltransferase involved in cell wall biosynthesis
MKIVHLSAFYEGGAGHAAYRLHKALLDAGEKSKIVFIQNIQDKKLLEAYSISNQPLPLRIRNKLKRENKIIKAFKQIEPEIVAEGVALPFSDYEVLKNPVVKDADVVHLHWIDGMIEYADFFKKIDKNIVWTLHDMNPLSGIFLYKEDEQINQKLAENLNSKVKAIKQTAYAALKTNMCLTTPSHWLEEQVRKSEMMRQFKCITIPYNIDLEQFIPENKGVSRQQLGLPADKIILLFSAMSIRNKRKGFDLLIDTLKLLNLTNVVLVALGKNDSSYKDDVPINFAGYITDSKTLCKYYSAANAFVLPSREDNLPNVMLEAFACGLPVIGFPVGGIKEHVIDGCTGYLADEVSSIALKNTLEKFLSDPKQFDVDKIRNYAKSHFNTDTIVQQYKQVYLRNAVT